VRTAGGLSKSLPYQASKTARRRALKRAAAGTFTHGQVVVLHRAQRGRCAICGARRGINSIHRDHVMPLSRGGANTIDNIQLLCRACNLKKAAHDPIVFMQSKGMLL